MVKFCLVNPDQPDLLFSDLIWNSREAAILTQSAVYPEMILVETVVDSDSIISYSEAKE